MLKPSIVAVALLAMAPAFGDVSIHGSLKKWHPVTLDNRSVIVLSESQYSPNPFLDYRFNVTFTSPTKNIYVVPGYFAGNGQGFGIGSVWRAKFSADEVGEWQYTVSFRNGQDVAVSLLDTDGSAMPSDGESGTFNITTQGSDAPGFLANGRLQYTGEHYLKAADGPHWIKGGVDSPENFLAYSGFDNTINQPEGAGTGGLLDGIHHYESHIADWQENDPLFKNSANPDGAKGIIGAINYLSSESVNSLYFLPMNLGGDGRDTYPFIRPSGSVFDNTHYDVSKLHQWGVVLNHMQNTGIAANIVLAEVELGNSNWFDDGTLGVERKLFYREMIARFSHLLALKWNISEESRFSTENHKLFAHYIDRLDWADHPISVHATSDKPEKQYNGIIGDSLFTASSIQFSPSNSDKFVEDWRKQSAFSGWPWVIDMDEVGPAKDGLTDTNADELRKSVLYPVYFSGGNIEWYFGYHRLPLGGDMRTEDFRTRQAMYRYMRYAREMMQTELPFWEMNPNDELHSAGATTNVQVFEKPGDTYAVYLPDATNSGTLTVTEGEYQQRWFNPRDGIFTGPSIDISTTGSIILGEAPADASEDWAVIITLADTTDVTDTPDSTDTDTDTTDPTDPTDKTNPTTTPSQSTDSGGSLDLGLLVMLSAGFSGRTIHRRRKYASLSGV